jgi:hypothetical protein
MAGAAVIRRLALFVAVGVVSFLVVSTALAQKMTNDDPPVEKKGSKKAKGTPDQLEAGGRVYVRDTVTRIAIAGDTVWLEDRTLDNARAFLSFRPNKRTRMDIEVDFAGDQAELKDTFIRYDLTSYVEVTAGRFKRPVSFIGLTSTWKLPRIDRGLLSELRIAGQRLLFAGGREEGVALGVELPGALRPELTFTVQESGLAEDLGLEIAEGTQDLYARAEVEPVLGLHFAVAGGWIGSVRVLGDPDSFRHRPFGTVEGFYENERLRVWLEGMGGLNANTYVGERQIGRFFAAQAMIAPHVELPGTLDAIEPYGAIGWYEPSTDEDGDQVTELSAGAALQISGKLRLQLEGGRRLAQGDRSPTADATILRVQLGAAFDTKVELP